MGVEEGQGEALDVEEPGDEGVDVLVDAGGEAGRAGDAEDQGEDGGEFRSCEKRKSISEVSRKTRGETHG